MNLYIPSLSITGIVGGVPGCLGSFLVISCWFHWGYPPNQLFFCDSPVFDIHSLPQNVIILWWGRKIYNHSSITAGQPTPQNVAPPRKKALWSGLILTHGPWGVRLKDFPYYHIFRPKCSARPRWAQTPSKRPWSTPKMTCFHKIANIGSLVAGFNQFEKY